jgi:hypothetical protein
MAVVTSVAFIALSAGALGRLSRHGLFAGYAEPPEVLSAPRQLNV